MTYVTILRFNWFAEKNDEFREMTGIIHYIN